MLQQRAICEFQRKQHVWLTAVLSANLKEYAGMEPPAFLEWILDEDVIASDLFKDEPDADVEEEAVVEKKRKRKEVKKGKRKVGEEEEELLETDEGESLSEGEKQENVEIMNQLNKESEEDDENTTEEEDFLDAEPDLDHTTDIEIDPPTSPHNITKSTTNIPSTTTEPILTLVNQPILEISAQTTTQPENQPQSPIPQTQEKESESLPASPVTSPVATTVIADSDNHYKKFGNYWRT